MIHNQAWKSLVSFFSSSPPPLLLDVAVVSSTPLLHPT
jgi:hypothetical protein